MRRAAGWVIAVVLLAAGTTAFVHRVTSTRCLPDQPQLSSTRVPAGGVVTLSGAPVRCRIHGISHATYVVSLVTFATTSSSSGTFRLTTLHPNRDGSFSQVVRLPSTASPGDGQIQVDGSVLDHCTDQGGKCAGYLVPVTITAGG